MYENSKKASTHEMKGKNLVLCLEDTLKSLKLFNMDKEQKISITLSEYGIYIENEKGCSINRPLIDKPYED